MSAGVTVGVGPAGSPVTVAVGVSGSRDSSLLNELNKYNEKVLKRNARVKQYSIICTEQCMLLMALKSTVGMEPAFACVIGNV